MHNLYRLRDMLCEELEKFGEHDIVSSGSLELVDKLAHAIKNLDKIIECEEGGENGYSLGGSYGYSRNSYENSERYPRSYGNNSYRRGRAANGRFVSRDAGEMARQIHEMINDAPDDAVRSELQRIASKLENM